MHLVAVGVDSIAQGAVKSILVLHTFLGAIWNSVDDTEGEGVDTSFKSSENLRDGLGERRQAQNTVFANDCGQ